MVFDFGTSEGGLALLGVVLVSCAYDFSCLYSSVIGVVEAPGSHEAQYVEGWLKVVCARMGINIALDIGSICHDAASNMTVFDDMDNILDLSCLVHLLNTKFKHTLQKPEYEKFRVPDSTRSFKQVHDNLHWIITTLRAGSAGGLRMQHFLRLQQKDGQRVLLKMRLGPDHKFVYVWVEWERTLKLWKYIMQLDCELMGNNADDRTAFMNAKAQLAADKPIIVAIAPILKRLDMIITVLSSEKQPLAGKVLSSLRGLYDLTEEIATKARNDGAHNVLAICEHFIAEFDSVAGADQAAQVETASFQNFFNSDLLKVCRTLLPSEAREMTPGEFDEGFSLITQILVTDAEAQEAEDKRELEAEKGAAAAGGAAAGPPPAKKQRLSDHADAVQIIAQDTVAAKLKTVIAKEKDAYFKFVLSLPSAGEIDDLKEWRTLLALGTVQTLVPVARKCAGIPVSNLCSERVMNHIDSVSGGRCTSVAPHRVEKFVIAHADMKNITKWVKQELTTVDEEDEDVKTEDFHCDIESESEAGNSGSEEAAAASSDASSED